MMMVNIQVPTFLVWGFCLGCGGVSGAAEDGPRPMDLPPLANVEPLSWAAPRVYLYPDFLSSEECDYLVGLALQQPSFDSSSDDQALTSVYLDWNHRKSDRFVEAIERRIGIVTGIPPHDDEASRESEGGGGAARRITKLVL